MTCALTHREAWPRRARSFDPFLRLRPNSRGRTTSADRLAAGRKWLRWLSPDPSFQVSQKRRPRGRMQPRIRDRASCLLRGRGNLPVGTGNGTSGCRAKELEGLKAAGRSRNLGRNQAQNSPKVGRQQPTHPEATGGRLSRRRPHFPDLDRRRHSEAGSTSWVCRSLPLSPNSAAWRGVERVWKEGGKHHASNL